MRKPEFTKEQLEYLQDLLTVGCCHTSGTHDPEHFSRGKYICVNQMSDAFRHAITTLNLEFRVRSYPGCGCCNNYPEKKKGQGTYVNEKFIPLEQ